ncbi:hypothetical protein M0804_003627 [Polistes exclamans]|nr:hypothetical protein M0804_003627 [Polistes exclamans]
MLLRFFIPTSVEHQQQQQQQQKPPPSPGVEGRRRGNSNWLGRGGKHSTGGSSGRRHPVCRSIGAESVCKVVRERSSGPSPVRNLIGYLCQRTKRLSAFRWIPWGYPGTTWYEQDQEEEEEEEEEEIE